jgi:hypothetical protein
MRTTSWVLSATVLSATVLSATVLSAAATPAFAQDSRSRGTPPQGAAACREVRQGSRVELVCDELTIEGSSPRAYVVLGRARASYEAPPLERDLAAEIPRTVQDTPF